MKELQPQEPVPTWQMRQAGKAIIEALQVYQFNLRLYGLKESKNLEEWLSSEEVDNKDLVIGYLKHTLDVPSCVYLAMQRAKISI